MLRPLLPFLFFASGVFGQANFSFVLSPTTGCTPVTVTFTDLSTGATFWDWNFGDGNTSTLQNPTHTYGVAGTYNITLTINHGSSSITKQITVHGSPVASFTLSDTLLCTGAILTVTNTSIAVDGVIDSVTWDFGDGNIPKTGLLTSYSHSYLDTGTYAINIIVTNSFGCSNASTGQLIKVRGPLAKFTVSPTASCQQNTLVNFTDLTKYASPSTTYFWNFGDPSSGANDTSSLFSPSHIFSSYNNYTITLTATDGGCSSTYTYAYSQQSLNLVITSADTVCVGATVFFSDTLSAPIPTKHHWEFGDPFSGTRDTSSLATTSHIYNMPGVYTITLSDTVNNSCYNRIQKNIYVRALPRVHFTASDSTFCKVPAVVNFAGVSPDGIKTWAWNFGDPASGSADTSSSQNSSHSYNQFGIYTIRLTATDSFGCTTVFIHQNYIIISPPAVSIITPADSGCDSVKVFLFNAITSTVQNDFVVNYFWNFGDGDTLSAAPPVNHIYRSCGIYTVSVTITTAKGCTAINTRPGIARVGNKPTADFVPVSAVVCYNAPLQFFDSSHSNGCPITAWRWNFGSNAQNPQYLYSDTGKLDVSLIVYSNGCPDTMTRDTMLTVHPPRPDFFPTYNCDSPFVVAFHDLSLGADSLIWNWGDNSPNDTNDLTPIHTYPPIPHTYTVTLFASNNQYGCHNDTTITINLTKPIARIIANDSVGCHPLIVSFTGGTSQDAVLYSWNFGDPASGGNNASGFINPNHTFRSSGYYTVQLVVTDIHGCHDTTARIIQATGPTAGFTVDHTTGCTPLAVAFTDVSDTFGAPIVEHHWYFNYPNLPADRIDTTATNVSHIFTQTGSYTILYIVTDANGCVDSLVKTNFIVSTFPKPSFPDSLFLCPGDVDTFKVNTGIQTYPKYSVDWVFGDGTGTITVPDDSTLTHQYTSNGIFNLTITVRDSNGCADSVHSKIYIFKPIARFDTASVTDYCGYTSLTLLGDNNNYINQWAYTVNGPFGLVKHNSSTSDSTFPVTLNYPGLWTATLIVTNIGGCTARIDTPLYIVQGPVGYFTFNPDSSCSPLTVTFHVDSAQNSTYIRYDFGDGVDSIVTRADSVIIHTYYGNNGATWIPHVYLGYQLGNQNCEVTLVNPGDTIVKIISPVSVNITQDTVLVLEGQKDTLTAVPYNSGWTYNWYVMPEHQSLPVLTPPTNAVYTATDGDKYIVLVAKDANGCEAYDTVQVIVIPCESDLKIPNVFTPNGDNLNDTYYIKYLCPITDFLITIYNRWGNVVYKSNDYNFHWNGKDDNGKECSDGVYYYIIHGKKKKLYGYINLIRAK